MKVKKQYKGGIIVATVKYNLGSVMGDNYSTEEQVVGTWIDGKPLYRKVVIIDNPSNKTTFSIDNIDEPINVIWKQVHTSGVFFSYNNDGKSISIIFFNPTSKNFEIAISNDFSGKIVAILEYTKTTDA